MLKQLLIKIDKNFSNLTKDFLNSKFFNFFKSRFANPFLKFFKNFKKHFAFNMLEVTISLVTIGLITSAFMPIITKHITHSALAIRQGIQILTDCSGLEVNGTTLDSNCKICYFERCLKCNKICLDNEYKIESECRCVDCKNISQGCVRCTSKKCERCANGYYLNKQEGKCEKCPKGAYCKEGDESPNPCAVYNSDYSKNTEYRYAFSIQNSTCPDPCPAGVHCSSKQEQGKPATPYTEPCRKGNYCPKGVAMTPCEPGKYQDEEGKAECKYCSPGTWGEEGRDSNCTDNCEAGCYCPGNATKNPCPIGKYSKPGQSECTNCPIGTYTDKELKADNKCTTKNDCTPCAKGYYQPSEGKTKCEICPIGKYQDTERQPNCKNCSPGKWSSDEGRKTDCTDKCPKKYYCPGTGEKPICPKGHYCPEGSSEPKPCPEGTYQDKEGAESCKNCSPGKWSSDKGRTSDCTDKCPEKHYCPGNGDDPICPVGSYCPEGSSEPKPCPAGQYTDTTGKVSCDTCPCGTYSNKGLNVTGSTGCKNCSAGKYNPDTEKSSCETACPAGKYCPEKTCKPFCCPEKKWSSEGSTSINSCTSCSAGSYCPGPTNCISKCCKAGEYSKEGSSSCSPCGGGQYSGKCSSSCTDCPAGYSCSASGIDSECTPGNYSPKGDRVCHPCDKGKYSSARAGSCSDCPPGTYQDLTGQSSCKNCPDGKYSKAGADDVSKCTGDLCGCGHACKNGIKSDCGPGTWSNAGDSSCTKCSPGKFSDGSANCSCKNCSPGKWSSDKGRTSDCPDKCPEKSYCPGDGETHECLCGYSCPAGSSNGTANICSVGHYSAKNAASCLPCEPGKWSSKAQCNSCTVDCECGYACSNGSKTACGKGTYSLKGKSSCEKCGTGTYSSGDHNCSCEECKAGTYQDEKGKSSCKDCPSGKYSKKGSVSCSPCTGWHAKCTACNQNGCTACTAGYKVSGTGCVAEFKCEGNFKKVGGLCITKFNAGDFSELTHSKFPSSVTVVNVNSSCYKSKCCWKGKTASKCGSSSTYTLCNRTVCTWDAGMDICANFKAGGKTWRMPTKSELNSFDGYGLNLCDAKTSPLCDDSTKCDGAVEDECYPNHLWSKNESGSDAYRHRLTDGDWIGPDTRSKGCANSVRCVTSM